MRRLSHQYPWAWISHVYYVECCYRDTQFLRKSYKNENVNTVGSLEADRIGNVRIFTFLSRTEIIGNVTFV